MAAATVPEIVYPESDGKPMAENMTQYRKIVLLRENVQRLRPNDLVAADNFIYPKEGYPKIVQAPDVYVALGRPPGDPASYKVWEENGVFPQVIFEVLSPGNRSAEMMRKLAFYDEYGAEEYYVYDPDEETISVWLRNTKGRLAEEPEVNGFVSPRVGFRIDTTGPGVVFRHPDGSPFLSPGELYDMAEQEKARAEQEKARAEQEKARAEQEKARADDLTRQLAALKAQLHAAGLNGD